MAKTITSSDIKVLHLARWYPNKFDPMFGLFVKKHAEASSIYCQSYVIYAHGTCENNGNFDIDYQSNANLTEIIIYYKKVKFKNELLNNFINGILFLIAIIKGFQKLKLENKKFNLIHIHVLSRLGIFGLFFKFFKNTPYSITEHWSRYLPATGDYRGFFRKLFTKIVVAQASFVSTVTKNLQEAMENHGLKNKNYFILPNVVSDCFYSNFEISKNSKKIFIHVSSFEDKSKNISGLIRVINMLGKKRSDFIFKIIGEGMDYDYLFNYAKNTITNYEVVEFTGLLQNEKLSKEFANASMMVVFSNYENFPVVINESLVVGLPVIATNVGGISETINVENGILLNAGDENQLAKIMNDFLDEKYVFDKEKIKEKYREKFSAISIGKTLLDNYNKALTN